MEESGKICNIVSKEYPLFFPHPGWSEQNPEDWYTQSMAGMKELTEGIDRSQVAGISFGGQMHGLVTLDAVSYTHLISDPNEVKASEALFKGEQYFGARMAWKV